VRRRAGGRSANFLIDAESNLNAAPAGSAVERSRRHELFITARNLKQEMRAPSGAASLCRIFPMNRNRLLATGVIGFVVSMLGCLTPALVALLAAIGISEASAGWIMCCCPQWRFLHC
jgi:hypothetical protein